MRTPPEGLDPENASMPWRTRSMMRSTSSERMPKWGVNRRKALAAVDDAQTALAKPGLDAIEAHDLDAGVQLGGEQQAGTLDLGDEAVELIHQAIELHDELMAAGLDVLPNVVGQVGEHGASDLQRAGVGGHRVAIDAADVEAGGSRCSASTLRGYCPAFSAFE